MSTWQPRARREEALQRVEARLAAEPDAVDLWCDLAQLLHELGRTDEAKRAYLEAARRDPTCFRALNNLGALLAATGFRTAARTAYAEAVAHHPENPMGHVNLANALRESGDLTDARRHYERALQLDADHPEAHQGMAYLLADLGEHHGAEEHRRKGFANRAITILPYRGETRPISVLLLVSAAGGNVPILSLLDDRVFLTAVIVSEFYDPDTPLPPHDLVFNAIGDADRCVAALHAARRIIARTSAPVVNTPEAVLPTGRVENANRLRHIPGVITPRATTLAREQITPEALARHGLDFPLLLRRPGFHTGQHFVRVEREQDLAHSLQRVGGHEVLVLQYLDARSGDGKFRKYRVMLIDGQCVPLHVAISPDWKVHYFTADMAMNAAHRAEDAAFLADMPGVLGQRAVDALRRLRTALGLDYAGVDFSLTAEGEVLLFEANATMVVVPPAPGAQWDYRRIHVQRVLDAIRAMLLTRALPGVR